MAARGANGTGRPVRRALIALMRLVVAAGVALPVAADALPAHADTCRTVALSDRSAEEWCAVSGTLSGQSMTVNTHTYFWPDPPPPSDLWHRIGVSTLPSGQPCWVRITLVGPDISLHVDPVWGFTDASNMALNPPCPPAPWLPTPFYFAADLAQRRPLPEPTPRVASPTLAAGLPMCVEAGQTRLFAPVSMTTPWGTIHVVGSAGVGVDWGDGAVGEYRDLGGVYPTCTVSHPYLSKGGYSITSALSWHLEYWIGDNAAGSRPLDVVATRSLPLRVSIIDVQAVVGAGA
jgi:hypothetical protein